LALPTDIFVWWIAAMEAVDRVMRAYSKTRDLTEEQAAVARGELSKFIDELMFGTIKQPDQDGQTSNSLPGELGTH
jgi:hypothetical protein